MSRANLTLTTAIAPALWGTTYITTTEFLPPHHPLLTALLRALPAGLLITLIFRRLPRGEWWWRAGVLGVLNIGLCFALLFIGAYRLPGGVAATIGAIQPLIVTLLGWPLLAVRPSAWSLGAGAAGVCGVGILVLGGGARLDLLGAAAALGGAASMALGIVLTKRWGRPSDVPVIAFTGWQLTAGGLLLAPFAILFEGGSRTISAANVGGYLYLGLVGTALAYTLWFRGIDRLPATAVSFLGLLIPIVATLAGWVAYRQALTAPQFAGVALVLGSIVVAQRPSGTSKGRRTIAHTTNGVGFSAPWPLDGGILGTIAWKGPRQRRVPIMQAKERTCLKSNPPPLR